MSDDTAGKRPSPEALLLQANQEGRGRLKIFLGAAPGVGKTYEMLASARRRRLEGTDVVIGVVETHGRVETDLLSKGIESIPKKRMLYRGHVMAEMDLDAILQRHPALVLVDELAHTNVEGSRHPKRYMDVEELLAAGIDVYTTLNIQHLESVKDVVAKITHVFVRESVPDSMLDRADEVEVVDITPGDLIQRLKDGKVYIPEQAERAIRNYFTEGNLTALRELALRRTAQRVDEQMLNYMQTHAIAGPWETSDRVLACISEDRGSAALVRYARRLADRLHAPWTALYVETPDRRQLREGDRDFIAECQRTAEELGGVSVTIPAADRADAVVNYAQSNNITHIVVSRTKRPRWSELLRGSTVSRLLRRARDINVHVMADRGEEGPSPAAGGADPDPGRAPGLVQPARIWWLGGNGCRGIVDVSRAAAISRHIEYRTRVPDRGSWGRGHLWFDAGAFCLLSSASSHSIFSFCRRFTPSPLRTRRTSSRLSLSQSLR